MHYMTHAPLRGIAPYLMGAILFEVVVGRKVGSSVHKQRVQPRESIFPEAIHFHVVDLRFAMNAGWKGTFRFSDVALEKLMVDNHDHHESTSWEPWQTYFRRRQPALDA